MTLNSALTLLKNVATSLNSFKPYFGKVEINASSERRTGSCRLYEKPYLRACGVGFAFRCCKIRKIFYYPFCSYSTERVIFLKKFFPPLTVKKLCVLGLLMAITALLSIFCTFRIGTVVKIPLKFISIFITGALFGPVFAGLTAAVGDLLNCFLAPSGPIIPQITVIEFLSGAVYGLFFFKPHLAKNGYLFRTILCVLVLFFIDMVLTTAVFTFWLGWYPSFSVAFATRIIAGIIKVILQAAVLLAARKYIDRFRQLC